MMPSPLIDHRPRTNRSRSRSTGNARARARLQSLRSRTANVASQRSRQPVNRRTPRQNDVPKPLQSKLIKPAAATKSP